MNRLYKAVMQQLTEKANADLVSTLVVSQEMDQKVFVVPPSRTRYLSEIAESIKSYDNKVSHQVEVAQQLYGIYKTIAGLCKTPPELTSAGIKVSGLDISGEG